ncbi:MAG: hypothetical protein R3D88_02295 [Alphaproteobacteria bacterium]|nr:hypothetical protein [Alphaproteobacteria bacterium]
MSKADAIVTKLEDLTRFIEEAQDKLREGEVLNLSHLDEEVARLCEETLTLPPQDAARVQPIMGTMISKLEELGMALKDFQTNLQNRSAS